MARDDRRQVTDPSPHIWGGLGRLVRLGFTAEEIVRLLAVKKVHREKGRHMTDAEMRGLE